MGWLGWARRNCDELSWKAARWLEGDVLPFTGRDEEGYCSCGGRVGAVTRRMSFWSNTQHVVL